MATPKAKTQESQQKMEEEVVSYYQVKCLIIVPSK